MLEKIYDKYDFDQDYEVYKYGQQVLIFNSIVNIFMFILGLCLHEGLMTLVWMLAFSGLRVNLGGYHCDSPVKCFVSSNLIFFLSMLSYKYLSSYFLLLFIPLGILFMLFLLYSVLYLRHSLQKSENCPGRTLRIPLPASANFSSAIVNSST